MGHQCKETLSGTLCLAVTLPTDSWPTEMRWTCFGCGRDNDSHLRICSSCTGGKRQRIWALYGRGEVLSTWMRLLYPAEAAHPSPSILLSTPDLLSLCLSPHNLMYQGLLLGSYARERATDTCGCLLGDANNNLGSNTISELLAAPSPEWTPDMERLLDESSEGDSVALELAPSTVSTAVRPVLGDDSIQLVCRGVHSPAVHCTLPQCTASARQVGVVGPSDHVPLEESGAREVQDVSSDEEDILVLDTSRELFGMPPVEPLLVTLDDEGNDRVVVVLSDDSMEDSMGGPGFGYVAPDVQEVPPPESPVFRSLDIRERLGRPGESEAMDRYQQEVRDQRNAERVRGRHRRATSTSTTTSTRGSSTTV